MTSPLTSLCLWEYTSPLSQVDDQNIVYPSIKSYLKKNETAHENSFHFITINDEGYFLHI